MMDLKAKIKELESYRNRLPKSHFSLYYSERDQKWVLYISSEKEKISHEDFEVVIDKAIEHLSNLGQNLASNYVI